MQRTAVSATAKINRKDFGVNWAKTMDPAERWWATK